MEQDREAKDLALVPGWGESGEEVKEVSLGLDQAGIVFVRIVAKKNLIK